ncbi:MAG: COX15/CtaA family protein [Polyangiales bacterium]
MPPTRRFAVAASVLLPYTVAVVLWGAFVRASLSGDGCGDHWPLCNGVVLPVEPSSKTIVELTHRVTSGLCWIATLAMWVWSLRLFRKGHPTRSAAGWSLLFMTTEALIGAGLVLFRMVADNPSTALAAWMSAHLTNTFLLLAALTWLMASAKHVPGLRWPTETRARALFGGAAALLLAAGVSGAVAALGDTLFPAASLTEALEADLSPSSHLFLRLRLWHPVLAIAGSGYLVWLTGLLLRDPGGTRLRVPALGLGVLALTQLALGFLNVALLAPVWLQLVHLLIADSIWIVLTLLALSSPGRIPGANLAA